MNICFNQFYQQVLDQKFQWVQFIALYYNNIYNYFYSFERYIGLLILLIQVKVAAKHAVGKLNKEEVAAQKKEKAAQVSVSRLLTDEDFKRIDAAQIRKQMHAAKGIKRPLEEPDKPK